MSSSSFSSDSCDYYRSLLEESYDRIIQPGLPLPWFSTIGNPLVYYAEVQPYGRRGMQGHQRKETRNYFARAFKWYTQERDSGTKRRISPELTGFATWLDSKYFEYLRESEVEPPLQPQRPSIVRTTSPWLRHLILDNNRTNGLGKTRKFPRMRSPWSKPRTLNKNVADMSCKAPTESCQFILKPKDITRPASECCYAVSAVCQNKSNTTVISTEIEGRKKTIVKSQSLTSICHERSASGCIDVITMQEGLTSKVVQKAMASCEKCKIMKDSQQVPPKLSKVICTHRQQNQTVAETPRVLEKTKKLEVPCVPSCVTPRVPAKLIPVPCDPSCAVRRGPAKTQKIDTCKSSCIYQQDHKHMEKTAKVPVKQQKIEIPCAPSCIYHPEHTPIAEAPTVSAEQQKTNMPCDSSCVYSPEYKLVVEPQMPAKPQKIENPCDLTCVSQPQYKPVVETRGPTRQQEMKISCKPSCVIQPVYTPVEESRIPAKPQKIEKSCDPSCVYQPENKHLEEPRLPAKPQKVEIPCDPLCMYQPQYENIVELRVSANQQKMEIPCEPSCVKQSAYKPVVETRVPAKPQKVQIPCDPSYVSQPQYEPVVETRISTKQQAMEFPCKPSCIIQPEYTPMVESRTLAKPQKIESPCDPSCVYQPEYKHVVEQRIPAKPQKVEIPCEPSCINQAVYKPIVDTRIPAKRQQIDMPCDPNCMYQPEYKPVIESRVPAKPKNMVIPCDPSCISQPQYEPVVETRVPANQHKLEFPCEPRCVYQPEHKPVVETRVPAKPQKTEIPCEPSCINQPAYKPIVDTRTPAKQPKMEIPCDPNCVYQPEYKSMIESKAVCAKSQRPDISCNTSCTYTQEYKPVEEIQPVLAKAQNLVTDSFSSCTYNRGEFQRASAKTQNIEIPCYPSCTYTQDNKTVAEHQIIPKLQSAAILCECFSVKPGHPHDESSKQEFRKIEAKKVALTSKKVNNECQCPETDESVDVNVQCECSSPTTESRSTTDALCRCVVLEKLLSIPVQVQPCKPVIQPIPKVKSKSMFSSCFSKKSQKVTKIAEVSCQCSEGDIIKFETPSQYNRNDFEAYEPCCNSSGTSAKPVEKPRSVCHAQTDSNSTRSLVTVKKVIRSRTIFRNDGVQTSDHSISLENNDGHEYALFMKIVCADKCRCD